MFFNDAPSFPHTGSAQEKFFQESGRVSMDPPIIGIYAEDIHHTEKPAKLKINEKYRTIVIRQRLFVIKELDQLVTERVISFANDLTRLVEVCTNSITRRVSHFNNSTTISL